MNRGRWQLLFASLFVALTWLVVLPAIASLPAVRRMIDRHEAAGIDPSAMYYTDVEHLTYRDGMLRRPVDRPKSEELMK